MSVSLMKVRSQHTARMSLGNYGKFHRFVLVFDGMDEERLLYVVTT